MRGVNQVVDVPQNCITSENEANGKTYTCTGECTDPAKRETDEQKSRWSAGCFSHMGKRRSKKSEAGERNPHFTRPKQTMR